MLTDVKFALGAEQLDHVRTYEREEAHLTETFQRNVLACWLALAVFKFAIFVCEVANHLDVFTSAVEPGSHLLDIKRRVSDILAVCLHSEAV